MLKNKFFTKHNLEAGVDEVGRGSLMGSVVAAAVILPLDFKNENLKDSKKLTTQERESLAKIIKEEAIAWAIAEASETEIDKVNILQATFLAMHRAIEKLKPTPEVLIIDGNRFLPYKQIPYHCIVKGDNHYMAIAAASILAKTHRDAMVVRQAKEFPEYQWQKNKGYATKKHREAIVEHGLSPLHRKTFRIKID